MEQPDPNVQGGNAGSGAPEAPTSVAPPAPEAAAAIPRAPPAADLAVPQQFAPKPDSTTDTRLMKDAIRALEEMRMKASGNTEELQKTRDADLDWDFIRRRNALYDRLTADYPTSVGKAVSKKEREETGRHHSTLVYGEINFESFGVAFEKIKKRYGLPGGGGGGGGGGPTPPGGLLQRPGGVFYDIGSGTGKPSVAAACLHPFERAGGVEILEGLYNTSLELKQKWDTTAKALLKEDGQEEETELEFTLGDGTDFLVKDWSDGDILFANSTCFDDSLMAKIAEKAASLKKGAIFITFTRRLPSTHFEVLEHEMYQMSWGGATVYIQQKTTEPVPAADLAGPPPAVEDEPEEDPPTAAAPADGGDIEGGESNTVIAPEEEHPIVSS